MERWEKELLRNKGLRSQFHLDEGESYEKESRALGSWWTQLNIWIKGVRVGNLMPCSDPYIHIYFSTEAKSWEFSRNKQTKHGAKTPPSLIFLSYQYVMLESNHLPGAQTRKQLQTLGHHCSKAPNSQGWENKGQRRQKWALGRTFWNKCSLKHGFWVWSKGGVGTKTLARVGVISVAPGNKRLMSRSVRSPSVSYISIYNR